MLYEQLSQRIIACAIEVHRQLGPGLPEKNYQAATAIEFKHQGIAFVRHPCLPVCYRGIKIGQYHPDFIVEGLIVIELKAVERYDPVFATQMLTGLLFNFNRPTLRDGLKRFVLSHHRANPWSTQSCDFPDAVPPVSGTQDGAVKEP